MNKFNDVRLEQIPKAENFNADALSKLGSHKEITFLGVILLEVQLQPSIPGIEVATVKTTSEVTWMSPIFD